MDPWGGGHHIYIYIHIVSTHISYTVSFITKEPCSNSHGFHNSDRGLLASGINGLLVESSMKEAIHQTQGSDKV